MKALVLLSGGVDSATCLALAKEKCSEVLALSMSYGQKHIKELESAQALANYYQVKLLHMDLAKIFMYSNSSLLQNSTEDIPVNSYAEQTKERKDRILSTYVPFRNGLFLSAAASIALSHNCDVIYYGPHKDDIACNAYPDCSKEFNLAISDAIFLGSGKKITVLAPFVNLTKKDIVKQGLKLKVPYELTWSCYLGAENPCHKCATCIDREAAFIANGIKDPLLGRSNKDACKK